MAPQIIKASFILVSMVGFLAVTQPKNIYKLSVGITKLVLNKKNEEKATIK
jgi:hypothetical protein